MKIGSKLESSNHVRSVFRIEMCCSCSWSKSIYVPGYHSVAPSICVKEKKKRIQDESDGNECVPLAYMPSLSSTALTNFISQPTSATSRSRLARKTSTSSPKGSSQLAALAVSASC